jgi:hypothetical protein
MPGGAPGAAQQAVDLAASQQHRADQRQAAAHLDLREACVVTPLGVRHLLVGACQYMAVAVVVLVLTQS